MTGDDLRSIRQRAGLNGPAFAAALGYTGSKQTLAVAISRLENGARDRETIPPAVARLAIMFDRFGIPDDLR
jgi:transcriptional regulator with XRE-family HTH domain